MAIFFFLVGLEIKRELLVGELSSTSRAALPAFAAVGGMLCPALVYLALNYADPVTSQGWAIPAATDIAFAVGVMAMLGSRIPSSLKIFLLAVAIIDDLGAIIIIALFYTAKLSVLALALAAAGVVLLGLLNISGVERRWPYILIGLVVWVCVLKSGVHATLAGVVTGLAIPLYASGNPDVHAGPLERTEAELHPWVKYGVLPLFAFGNAGVALTGLGIDSLLGTLTLGIVLGLVLGKPIGVFLFSWLAVSLKISELPAGTNWGQILGAGCLAGIGFTMSLFIGMLAFDDPAYAADIRVGVLVGSIISAVVGFLLLSASSRKPQPAAVDT